MDIKTKYSIRDKVCTLYNNRIVYGCITNINIIIDHKSEIEIKYHIQNSTYIGENVYFKENKIFKTQEELLEELLEVLRKNDSL